MTKKATRFDKIVKRRLSLFAYFFAKSACFITQNLLKISNYHKNQIFTKFLLQMGDSHHSKTFLVSFV